MATTHRCHLLNFDNPFARQSPRKDDIAVDWRPRRVYHPAAVSQCRPASRLTKRSGPAAATTRSAAAAMARGTRSPRHARWDQVAPPSSVRSTAARHCAPPASANPRSAEAKASDTASERVDAVDQRPPESPVTRTSPPAQSTTARRTSIPPVPAAHSRRRRRARDRRRRWIRGPGSGTSGGRRCRRSRWLRCRWTATRRAGRKRRSPRTRPIRRPACPRPALATRPRGPESSWLRSRATLRARPEQWRGSRRVLLG